MKTLKPVLTMILVIALIDTCCGQLQQGSLRVGGTFNFTKTKSTINPSGGERTSSSLSINPDISFFVIDNLSIGLTVPITSTKSESNGFISESAERSVGPIVRYYFPFGKWSVFPEVSYTLGKSKFSYNINDPIFPINYSVEVDVEKFSAGAGLTYFINKHVGVEVVGSYTSMDNGTASIGLGDTNIKSFGVNLGLQVYLHRQQD